MLICDLCEYYGILNYEKINPLKLAILVYGLSENSRIKRELTGQILNISDSLIASCVDRLGILIWQQTKDGAKNRNRPKGILELIKEENNKEDVIVFDSKQDFIERRKKLLKGG